jgi:hypothetical protein
MKHKRRHSRSPYTFLRPCRQPPSPAPSPSPELTPEHKQDLASTACEDDVDHHHRPPLLPRKHETIASLICNALPPNTTRDIQTLKQPTVPLVLTENSFCDLRDFAAGKGARFLNSIRDELRLDWGECNYCVIEWLVTRPAGMVHGGVGTVGDVGNV